MNFSKNLLQAVPCKTAFRLYFKICLIVEIGLACVILLFAKLTFGLVPAFGFILFIMVFRWTFRKSTDPFVLIFLTFSMIYIELPIVLMACAYPDYLPSNGINIPASTPTALVLSLALVLLSLFYVFFFFAIKVIPVKELSIKSEPTFLKKNSAIIIAVILVIIGYFYENCFSSFVTKKSPHVIGEMLRLITNEYALITAIFLVLNYKSAYKASAITKRLTLLYFCIAIGYILSRTISGSRGAIISIVSLGFVYPMALLGLRPGQKILVPSTLVLFFVGLILPFTYPIGQFFRLIKNYGNSFSVESAWNIILKDLGNVSMLSQAIGERLSTGFNRYILIFSNYYENGSTETCKDLPRYIFENTINLFAPGTPFPKSYYMSSMQFESVLLNKPFTTGTTEKLLSSLNTQPFTGFGVCILFAGITGPVLYFIILVLLRILYKKTNFWGAVFALIFFDLFLSCYGVECAFQNAALFVSTLLFVSFISGVNAGKYNLYSKKSLINKLFDAN